MQPIGLTEKQYADTNRQVEAGYLASQGQFNDHLQQDLRQQQFQLSLQRDVERSLSKNPEMFANLPVPRAEFATPSVPTISRQQRLDQDLMDYAIAGGIGTSPFNRAIENAFDRMLAQPRRISGPGVSGIVPFGQVRELPNAVSAIEGMPSRGNYQIVANLPIVDGEVSNVPAYYSAYNTLTKTTDYVIGQTDLSRFLKSTAAYESMTYMTPYERESLAMMNSIVGGDVAGALVHLGNSYAEAVQDPSWWFQIGTSFAGGVVAKEATLARTARIPDNPTAYSVAFETQLVPADFGRSRAVHFNRANAALGDALRTDPEFAAMMDELIPAVQSSVSKVGGRMTPDGWTWEHASSSTASGRSGVMRLVPTYQHMPGSPFWRVIHPDLGARGGYYEWAIPAGAPKN